VLCLGNIAGDRVEWRNYLLKMQADQALVGLYMRLGTAADLELTKRLAWALGNLIRGDPPPCAIHVYEILPVFCDLLNSPNESLLAKALWGLSHIAKGGLACTQLVINAKCLPKAVECLTHSNRLVHLSAASLVGQVSLGDNDQTEQLFALDVLEKLSFIILSRDPEVRRQSFWVLSNLTADSSLHASQVINSSIIFLSMKGLTDEDTEVKREASFVFRNIGFEINKPQAFRLASIGIVPVLKDALQDEEDPRIILNLADLARVLLYYGKSDEASNENPMRDLFCSHGVLEVFAKLFSHPNSSVVNTVQGILECYFELVDDDCMVEEVPDLFQFS
jgi:hypothetical protein